MFKKYKSIILFLIIFVNNSLQAVILNEDEATNADLSVLQDEIVVFQSISMGITLSIAYCEQSDTCSLPMEEKEIEQLINTLENRITSLAARQGKIDDIIGFNKVLSLYIAERDSYTEHLEKIKIIKIKYTDADSAELGVDPGFPVEAAIDQELLDYLNDLTLFEDEEIKDDDDLEGLPQFEEINKTPQ